MADEAVPLMAVVNVRTQQPRHQGRQLLGLPKLQQQVEVVGHQAVMEQAKVEALAVAGQQPQEMAAGVVVEEDGVAVVAAVEDMVAAAFGPLAVAGDAWHGRGSGRKGDRGRSAASVAAGRPVASEFPSASEAQSARRVLGAKGGVTAAAKVRVRG